MHYILEKFHLIISAWAHNLLDFGLIDYQLVGFRTAETELT